MSKKLLTVCRRVFWRGLKNGNPCVQRQNLGKNVFIVVKEILFFFAFVHLDFFCGFRQIDFGSVAKNAFYVTKEKFWVKTLFAGEKLCFLPFSDFGPFFRLYSNFLRESSKLHSKYRNFFFLKKNSPCYSWAWSKQIWSFVKEFPAGLSNSILCVHRNFLRNNLFSGESRFFFYLFWILSRFLLTGSS